MALLFFLAGCQPKRPLEGPPVEEISPAKEMLRDARQYERLGELDRAYEAYAAFVRRQPAGEEARDALLRMAQIRYGDRRFKDALALFERIDREYPSHPERAHVGLHILNTLFRVEAYERCRSEAEAWLQRYAGSPLEGDVLFLKGQCDAALGRPVEAFFTWIRAAGLPSVSAGRLEELDKAVADLIETATAPQLQAMGRERTNNPFLPLILHRIATLHMETGDLTAAREAALKLLEATSSPDWTLQARRILARIDEELSVRKGRIGCLLPLSGPFAIYGRETLNGIEMGASPWFSREGEAEIELIIRDTRGDAETSAAAVEELIQKEQVMAIVGPLSSKAALAAAERAQELGAPIITLAQKEEIPAIGEMVFRNFLTPAMEVSALVDQAFHGLGFRRFGILYPDNPYGQYFMGLFWDRVEALGGTITAVEAYPPDKTDYGDEVRRMVGLYYPRPPSVVRMLEAIKAQSGVTETESDEPEPIVDFDAVFIPDNSDRVALLAPQFPFHRVLGVRLLGTSLWQSGTLIELAGDYIRGAVFPSGFFPESDVEPVPSFVADFHSAFGQAPGPLAANGYDTIRFLKKVLGERGVQTRKELQRALCATDDVAGVTGTIRFDESGEVQRRPQLLTVSRGRFEAFVPPEPPPDALPDEGGDGEPSPLTGITPRSVVVVERPETP